MENILIEKIQKPEIDEVAGILTDAFKTNAAYSMVFRKKDRLKEGLLRNLKDAGRSAEYTGVQFLQAQKRK